jgi:hypothetical protein
MFCSECGGELREIRDLSAFWAAAYRCSRNEEHTYFRLSDARWIYPILPLQRVTAEKIEHASADDLALAFSRIKRIDYQTISIIFFEHTLLGQYDASRDYSVSYPGSNDK